MDTIKTSFAVLLSTSIFSISQSYADLSVGDSYGGGTVFCVSQTPDITKCIPQGSGNYGLIMANEDQVNFDSNPQHGVTWASEGIKTGAVSDDDGLANTQAVIAAHPKDNPSNNAAWLIQEYNTAHGQDVNGNLTVWYLPAENELNKMYLYGKASGLIGKGCAGSKLGGVQCLIGGDDDIEKYSEEKYASKYNVYWSSTEHSGIISHAWRQRFSLGPHRFPIHKAHWLGVRAVRAFINLSIKPFKNLPTRQAMESFIHHAEETGSVHFDELHEILLQAAQDREGMLRILSWLKITHTVTNLNFANIDLREFIDQLCELFAARGDFTVINLTNCNLDAVGIRRLLQNYRGLTHLYLGWNNIGDKEEDAAVLAEILQHNSALTVLDLRSNRIGNRGTEALARILQNHPTLTTLNLENNVVDNDMIVALTKVLQNNVRLNAIYLGYNNINLNWGAEKLFEALQDNPSLIVYDLHNNSINDEMKSKLDEIYGEKILLKLLRKIKRASCFTFAAGLRHNLIQHMLSQILEYAGLNVRNRAVFEDVRGYDTEENRRIIFNGTLEEIIRLFYCGNHADYAETIREINQLRRQQREFLQRHEQEIPAGQLLELPEGLPVTGGFTLIPERVAAAFWPAS